MKDRDFQRLLAAAGYYSGALDGDYGPKAVQAEGKVLERNQPEVLKWSPKRRKIAAAQIILNKAGYSAGKVDGYLGANTQEAFNAWDYQRTYGKPEVLPGRDVEEAGLAPLASGARWPDQRSVRSFFGEAGGPQCTAGTVELPIPFRLAWNKVQKVRKVKCHEKVAEPLTAIWQEAVRSYGEGDFIALGLDLFGGCYNYRPMRGGTALSMHAYGIAWDVDPERNQLRWGRDRASLAGERYNTFWGIVEAQGGISLGRVRNYDWMHFQFATL